MEQNMTPPVNEESQIVLPPGFRFHPTDEELISHYLSKKVMDSTFSCQPIGEVDLNKSEPWDLPWKAKMGEKEWYFFCLRDRKYPTGLRTNRATESGYWKATGKDKEIYRGKTLVGMKKTLVFYGGRAPKGQKSNWVMHEFRSQGKPSSIYPPNSSKNQWVISRVFQKKVHISCSSSLKIKPVSELAHVPCFSKTTDFPLNFPSFYSPQSCFPSSSQFPNMARTFSASQETGLSSDMNNEMGPFPFENMENPHMVWNC